MSQSGLNLTLLIGPTVPIPASVDIMEALESVEVTHNDRERSGFQIVLKAGRSGPTDFLEFGLLKNPVLQPFNRVIMVVTLGVIPRVLMDGIITHQQLSPSNEPGVSRLVITGEDVSLMMDMEEKSIEYPAQDETVIANRVILSYAQYGLVPLVIPPLSLDPPIPTERTPVQQATDLQYLQEMAQRYGYVFYISPGPVPGLNTAYWGPPVRTGIPQKALSINMGPDTNVEQLDFSNDSLRPTFQSGSVQDRLTNQVIPVETFVSTRPPLVSQPAWLVNQPNIRRRQFRRSGLNAVQAYSQAQGLSDASMDDVVTANGVLDALKYEELLQPRMLVDVRGAGYSYDGTYYVKNVTHTIRRKEYKQRFTLSREGTGALSPVVRT
jgi:hypothetical protein